VLGFCIAVKLQPLGIPLLLLARRRYRLVAATAAAAAAFVAVGGVLSGFDVLGRYLASVAEIASRGSLASWNNQTITAMLLRATHPAAEIFQWRYLETAWWMTALQLAVALGLAAGTGGDGGEDHSVSYAGGVLVSLLLTPIAWTHAYVLLLLPLLWLAARLPQHHSFRRRVVWLAVLAVAWTLIALDAQSIASGVFPAGARAADGGAASLICSANLFGLLLLSVLCALVMARRRAAVE
jgi:hypothetical protein